MHNFLKRNLYSLYVLKISHWLMLVMPIIVLFYYSNHLSLHEIFILQAVYSVSIVALEIPTGYLADVWGRRNTLIIGAFMGFFGYLIYTLTHSFFGFLCAEILLGIGQSFISGTDTALLYDTLLAHKQENTYLKIEGQITSVGNFAEAIAGILGGLLATVSLRLPFVCQMFVALLAVPAALLVVEPQIHNERNKLSFRDILGVFKNTIIENNPLRNYIMLSSVVGASTLTMAWFVQPFFKDIDIPTAIYGVLWTILNFIVGLASLSSHHIERRLGRTNVILIILLFVFAGYVGMGIINSWWGFVPLVAFYIIRGIATPVLKEYINKLTASETRATILSIRNFIIRVIFAIVGPLVGFLSDKFNLQTAMILAGTVYVALAIPWFILIKKPALHNRTGVNRD